LFYIVTAVTIQQFHYDLQLIIITAYDFYEVIVDEAST